MWIILDFQVKFYANLKVVFIVHKKQQLHLAIGTCLDSSVINYYLLCNALFREYNNNVLANNTRVVPNFELCMHYL